MSCPQSAHPYFIATQFHPEFKSRPNHAHPLFAGLIAAALTRKRDKPEPSADHDGITFSADEEVEVAAEMLA